MNYKKVLQYTKDLKVLYVEDDENLLEDTVEILEDYFDTLDTYLKIVEASMNKTFDVSKWDHASYFKYNQKCRR